MADKKDRLTNATEGRSFPYKNEKMSSRTSRLRLSAETMIARRQDALVSTQGLHQGTSMDKHRTPPPFPLLARCPCFKALSPASKVANDFEVLRPQPVQDTGDQFQYQIGESSTGSTPILAAYHAVLFIYHRSILEYEVLILHRETRGGEIFTE